MARTIGAKNKKKIGGVKLSDLNSFFKDDFVIPVDIEFYDFFNKMKDYNNGSYQPVEEENTSEIEKSDTEEEVKVSYTRHDFN